MKRFRPLAAVMFTMLLVACVAGTPTPLSPSASAVPQIVAFEVSPNPVERGDDLRITWQVDGASRATLWSLTYDSKMGRWYRQPDPISSGSSVGEYRLSMPGDANQALRFELEATNAAGHSVAATSPEIQLVCHPLFFEPATTPWCPSAPETASAAFQAFEGGYMIWRGDTGQVYALRQPSGAELPFDWFAFFPTEEVVSRDIPPDRFAPGEHFQRAWASLPEYWRSLGWAIAPEQTYSLTLQFSFSPNGRGTSDDLYLSWPDGRIAHLLVYLSAPNHAGGPAWSFVDSPAAPTPISSTPISSDVFEAIQDEISPSPSGSLDSTRPAPTARSPRVLRFDANRSEVVPGDNVTFTWISSGGITAALVEPVCCTSIGGNLVREVPPNGSLALTLDAAVDRDTLTYILNVSDGVLSDSKSIRVRLPCPDAYFFAPQRGELECPSGPPVHSAAAQQIFERGRMIWLESQDKVYVLFGDGLPNPSGAPPDEFLAFDDTWQPGEPESDPTIVPPSGLYQPLRGFGKVWRNWPEVRDGLGWALASEQAFDGVYQRAWKTCLLQNNDGSFRSCSGPSNDFQYLRAADDRVIRLTAFGALGRHSVQQWGFWTP